MTGYPFETASNKFTAQGILDRVVRARTRGRRRQP
jgi:hypothetical protein